MSLDDVRVQNGVGDGQRVSAEELVGRSACGDPSDKLEQLPGEEPEERIVDWRVHACTLVLPVQHRAPIKDKKPFTAQ